MLIRASLTVLTLSLAVPARAGAPAPPVTEAELVSRVGELKKSKAAVMPDDNFPRTLRLASALYGLGSFYEAAGRLKEADASYADALSILLADKSAAGVDYHRLYSDSVGKAYLGRGDFARAKKHIDVALAICRTDDRERAVLPTVLSTLAAWHARQKQWPQAEVALLEAIKLRGAYAYPEQLALIDVYLDAGRLEDAGALITEAQKSKYSSSSVSFRRARWLRATGKAQEADVLEAQAKAKQKAEEAANAAAR